MSGKGNDKERREKIERILQEHGISNALEILSQGRVDQSRKSWFFRTISTLGLPAQKLNELFDLIQVYEEKDIGLDE